ncbi:MAG: ABC transporter ATP-binding protein, partial [Mesorhizobium sp.]
MTTITLAENFAPAVRLDHAARHEQPIIDARNIEVAFKVEHGTVEAVKDVSFQLYRGETIAIVGESGSGKSVTARTVMGLLSRRATVSPRSSVDYLGQNILKFPEAARRKLRGNRISMIFQEPMSSLNPIYTVGSQIVEAIRVHRRVSRREAWARALELLKHVQIPEPEARLKQYPHQLSGGQRQRVMIAMALANDPDVLIADEPTTALDVTVQAQILNLIRNLQKELKMAVILITHDLTVVRKFSDYVYVMQHGEMREHNITERLFANPQHPYTQRLLASEPHGRPQPLPEGSGTILEANGVRVCFMLRHGTFLKPDWRELVAVDDLDLKLCRHETLGLVGESGSGKTTFGQALLRLQDAKRGEIR